MYCSTEIIKDQDPLSQSYSLYTISVGVSYHCPGEMRISVPRQYPMSWSENYIEMRVQIPVEFGELQSGQRSFVSDLIMSTPVHCPGNLGDKEQGIWWDSLLAMLGSSCLDYLKHPDSVSSSLISIWVRTSCVITLPWSERGAPHKASCNLCSNSDSTCSASSDSKKFVKIFSDTIFLKLNLWQT